MGQTERAKQLIRELESELPDVDALIASLPPEKQEAGKALKSLALARSVEARANGKVSDIKNWSFERWVSVLTLGVGVGFWLWMAGGRLEGVFNRVDHLSNDVAEVQKTLEVLPAIQQDIAILKMQMSNVERDRTGRVTPTFRSDDRSTQQP